MIKNGSHSSMIAVAMALILSLAVLETAAAGVSIGKPVSAFKLVDMDGQSRKLTETQGRQMTVLYFFDAGSPASQEGLVMLDGLLKRYADQQLTVWGITRSDRAQISDFMRKANIGFPLLLDSGEVSRQYDAQFILPVMCSLGPDLKVLDYYQGGGKTAEKMLLSLAQRQLNRKQPQLAEAIGKAVAAKDPQNLEARAVQGYAAIGMGKLDEAQAVFKQIETAPGQGEVVGKEGRAAVLASRGRTDDALALAQEVTQKAPDRSYAYKIKGDMMAQKGDEKAAAEAYREAVRQTGAPPFQIAQAHNQLGRLYAREGSYAEARGQFNQALDMDPYYLEPTSNKGVTYEKQRMWSDALKSYRQALALDSGDAIAAVLAQKAEKILALQKDSAAKQRMDRLIVDLVARYKNQKKMTVDASTDTWTSRPMVFSLVDVRETGGMSPRDGLSIVLATRIGELLNDTGRVNVVDRAVIEQLLSELNLGSSELADPNTTLKLGRLMAAKIIGTGSLIYLPDSTLLNLRLIDTETSAVVKTITRRMTANADLEHEMYSINRTILKTIMEIYPLQGYVVQTNAEEVILNLGSSRGVTVGSAFEVIEEGKQVVYKGKVLSGSPKTVAALEVISVEPDYCVAGIKQKKRPLVTDDKVREVLPDVDMKGSKNAN